MWFHKVEVYFNSNNDMNIENLLEEITHQDIWLLDMLLKKSFIS